MDIESFDDFEFSDMIFGSGSSGQEDCEACEG